MFVVRRFGAWRIGVAVAAALATAGVAWWAIAGGAWLAAWVALAALGVATVVAFRVMPYALHWNSQGWSLAQPPERPPIPGSARVAIDLGRWMLIRFDAEGARRARWLPVSAGEAGASWRAWRAALFGGPRGAHG